MDSSHYCTTPNPDWKKFHQTFNAEYYRTANNRDDKSILYIQTRYVVLYCDNNQKLPLCQIKAAHTILNTAFSATNTSELSKVPDSSMYPWRRLIGNPNVQFLPIQSDRLTAEYINISVESLDNNRPVDDAFRIAGVTSKVLNIYIGNTSNNVLGQSTLGSNVVYVCYKTLGNEMYPGEIPAYALSKTLVHEVGHALSLPHTFSDNVCDHSAVFPDVPEQIAPNYDTILYQSPEGDWNCSGDNRDQDRNTGSRYSCLHMELDPSRAPNEMGINYMDYGEDKVSVMFTKSQATMMRAYLQGQENTTLELLKDPQDYSGSALNKHPVLFSKQNTFIVIVCILAVLALFMCYVHIYYNSRKALVRRTATVK